MGNRHCQLLFRQCRQTLLILEKPLVGRVELGAQEWKWVIMRFAERIHLARRVAWKFAALYLDKMMNTLSFILRLSSSPISYRIHFLNFCAALSTLLSHSHRNHGN